MFLDFFRNQVILRDLNLFFLCIAGHVDHFHSVQKGSWNGIDGVGRCNEHHLGKIKWHFQVMVRKFFVLFRVQDFQQRGSWVAFEISADLIHFVEKEHRILAAGFLDGGDDAAWNGSDIGSSVSANLRFVPDAAQGHSDKIPVDGSGNRLGNGRFSDSRRSYKAQNRPLQALRELNHCQVFQYPFLDLFQSMMILIENLFRLGKIDVSFLFLMPRKAQDRLDIGSAYRRLGAGRLHLTETLDFFLYFFVYFLVQFELFQLFQPVFHFVFQIFADSQFILNRPHLLPQIVFPLVFVHLRFYFGSDVLLNIENFNFSGQKFVELFQPFIHIGGFQQNLLVFNLDIQMGADHIREAARLFNARYCRKDFRSQLLVYRQIFVKPIEYGAH